MKDKVSKTKPEDEKPADAEKGDVEMTSSEDEKEEKDDKTIVVVNPREDDKSRPISSPTPMQEFWLRFTRRG